VGFQSGCVDLPAQAFSGSGSFSIPDHPANRMVQMAVLADILEEIL
jgi:hypothetical protein